MSKGWVTAHEETFPVVKLPEVPRCCPVLTSNSGFGIAFALLSCPLLARVWSRDAITWGLLSKASCTNWSKVKTVFVWVCVCAHNEWEKQLTAAMRASWITRCTAIKLGPTVFHQKKLVWPRTHSPYAPGSSVRANRYVDAQDLLLGRLLPKIDINI
jgi:hypothetical protein